jgi:two-component system sensor histidine kinase QseC
MNSIQRRLSLTVGAICCLLWFAGSLIAYFALRAGLISQFDLALTTDIQALANMTEQTEAGFKFDSSGEFMPKFQREDHPDYFQVWLPDGSTLYRSPSLDEERNLQQHFGALQSPKFWNVTLPDGTNGRAVGIRFAPKEDEDMPRSPGAQPLTQEVTLVAGFHRAELDNRLRYLGTVLLLVGATVAAATAAVVSVIVPRGLRPLSALGQRAEAIDASSLQLRFPTDNIPSELLPIAQRLNDLLTRLEDSFARERRFSADVAHELRTPIAELRTLTEVALKWPDDVSQVALKEALNIAVQMESTANGLMALARCEGSLLTLHPERVPLAAVFQEAYQPLEAKARTKQLAVDVDIPRDACWYTDRVILRSIISNLVSNAIDHTRAASSVKARVEKNGAGQRFLISNPSEGLAPSDVPHMFERFWQKDAARSSPDHCGLGLAVARAYAQSLGMKLDAELDHTEVVFILSDAAPCNGA